RKAGPFVGNDSTTEFAFAFKVYDKSHLTVYHIDELGASTLLTLDSDFEVVLNDDQDQDPGGIVRYPHPDADPPRSPLTPHEKLIITTDVPVEQTVVFNSAGGFFPKTVEQRLDYLTILLQNVKERLSRALLVGHGASRVPDVETIE